jgi:hypothetical protein
VVEVNLSIPFAICGDDITVGKARSSNSPTEAPTDRSSRRGAAGESDRLGDGAAPLGVGVAIARAGRDDLPAVSWPGCGVSTGRMGVDGRWLVSTAHWEPQEEGMMSTVASLPSVVKPRFIEPVGESQTS